MARSKLSGEVAEDLFLIKPAKWSLVVVMTLESGTRRFSELNRAIEGISQKSLASTLKDLERDGFVSRTHYATIPPRVEYDLTVSGRDLLAFAAAWKRFVITHHDAVTKARREYDSRNDEDAPASFIIGQIGN